MDHAPEMLAVLNKVVLGLAGSVSSETNVAHARREFASHLDKALARLVAWGEPDFATALPTYEFNLAIQLLLSVYY
jgi:hypothetical protein